MSNSLQLYVKQIFQKDTQKYIINRTMAAILDLENTHCFPILNLTELTYDLK